MKPDLKNLIKTLGIEKLPQDEQEKLLEKINQRLEEVVLGVVIESLSEDEAKKMRGVISGGNVEEEVTKITSKLPMLAEKIEYAITRELERLQKLFAA